MDRRRQDWSDQAEIRVIGIKSEPTAALQKLFPSKT